MKHIMIISLVLISCIFVQYANAYESKYDADFAKLGKSHIKLLVEKLDSTDTDIVYSAIKRIGELKTKNTKALSRIRIWLKETDPNEVDKIKASRLTHIFKISVWALSMIGNDNDAKIISARLQGAQNKENRIIIIRALGNFTDSVEARKTLNKLALEVRDERIAREVVSSISKFDELDSQDALETMSKRADFSKSFQKEIAKTSEKMLYEASKTAEGQLKVLRHALESEDLEKVQRAIKKIGELGLTNVRDRVRIWYGEANPTKSKHNASYLAKLKGIFHTSIWTLTRIGNDKDAETMALTLRGLKDKQGQLLIITALGEFPESKIALETLNELTAYVDDERIARKLVASLIKFNSSSSQDPLMYMSQRAMFSPKFQMQVAAAGEQIAWFIKPSKEKVFEEMETDDLYIVHRAIKRIGREHIKKALPRVRIWLSTSDPTKNSGNPDISKLREIYNAAIWTIGRIGDEKDSVILSTKIRGMKDKPTKIKVIRALAELPPTKDSVDTLNDMTTVVSDARIGNEIVNALEKINSSSSYEPLKEMAKNPRFSAKFQKRITDVASKILIEGKNYGFDSE